MTNYQEILDELLPILMEGKLSDVQKSELDGILLADEEARQYYNDYIDTHIALDWHFAGNSLELPCGLESAITPAKAKSKEPKKFPFKELALAVAALIAIGLFVTLPTQTENHYSVSNSASAVWAGQKAYVVGEQVDAKTLNLQSGYGELQTKDGVKLLIEGPAEIELISAQKVILNKGSLVASVPTNHSSFKVDTPKAQVLTSSREFAVSVEANGDTEIHSFNGQLQASSSGKEVSVNNFQAHLVTANQSTLAKADASRFMRILPEKPQQQVSYINWSFNEGQGQEAAQRGKNLEDKNFNAYLRSTYKDGSKPQWIDGKFGKALNFDAKGGYLETDFPGIGGSHARTVSFWVKIPQDAVLNNAVSMIAWGSYKGKGNTWQIAWNWKKSEGVVGALRAGIFHGQIVGTQDLRDGQWHHVAVVMFGGEQANVSTHLLLYVDGQLEQASRKSILNVQTDIDSEKSIKVLMGRNAMAHARNNEKHMVFNGALDEVYIFNCALDENQIRNLMNYNKSGLE